MTGDETPVGPEPETPYVVLGAGAAGLAAGLELARMGRRVVVLERESFVGGLCAGLSAGGLRFDLGLHRVATGDSAVEAFLREFLGPNLLCRPRRDRVLVCGRLVEHPAGVSRVLGSLPPRAALACGASLIAGRIAALAVSGQDRSLAGWASGRLGRRLAGELPGAYAAKVWGRDPGDLLASLAGEPAPAAGQAPWSAVDTCLYVEGGIGPLFEHVAAEIQRLGGEVRLSADPVSLTWPDPDRSVFPPGLVAVRWWEGPRAAGTTRFSLAAGIISSIPLDDLLAVLHPPPPALVREAGSKLAWRALVVAALIFEAPRPVGADVVYVPDASYVFSRVGQPLFGASSSLPGPGTSLLLVELNCDHGDGIWGADWERLGGRILDDLRRLGLVRPGEHPGEAHLFRARRAYPVGDLGSERRRRTILSWLDGVPALETCGRQGLFRNVDLRGAVLSGREAARRLARVVTPGSQSPATSGGGCR